MYQVDMSFFNEKDEREWGDWYKILDNLTYEEADEFAQRIVSMTNMLTRQLKKRGYDGCSIDIREMVDAEPYIASYEFMLGRQIDVWHFEECHEVKE